MAPLLITPRPSVHSTLTFGTELPSCLRAVHTNNSSPAILLTATELETKTMVVARYLPINASTRYSPGFSLPNGIYTLPDATLTNSLEDPARFTPSGGWIGLACHSG
ncbi:hypothetical protein D3C76_1587010 [compost metagenome]